MGKAGWDEDALIEVARVELDDTSNSPSTPITGQFSLYSKDGHLHRKNSSGVEIDLESTEFSPQENSLVLFDDFNNHMSWSPSTSGTNSSASVSLGNSVIASGKHIGVAELSLGSVVAGSSHASLVQSAGLSQSTVFDFGPAEYQTLIYIPTLASASDDYVLRIGFGTATNADHANGIYFEYDRSQSANWRLRAASQSSRTTTTTSVAVVADTWIHLKWSVNGNGTQADFFIDDVSVGTVTTNIPVTTGQGCGPNFQITSSSILAATRNVYIDYFYFVKEFTARD